MSQLKIYLDIMIHNVNCNYSPSLFIGGAHLIWGSLTKKEQEKAWEVHTTVVNELDREKHYATSSNKDDPQEPDADLRV